MGNRPLTWDHHFVPRPATGKTPTRNLRIADEVWGPAKAKAKAEGSSVNTVVVDYLRRYIATPPPGGNPHSPWDVVNLVVRALLLDQENDRLGPDTDLEAAAQAATDLLQALGVEPRADS
jgi:hypothetical protein